MTKKVIFVGGTQYSGSTFFHLTLANDPKGFAVGEVKSLFRPTRPHHRRSIRKCQCGDPNCDLWDRVEKRGMDNLYESIFDIHPEVEFIVDSNKDILWTQHHRNRLVKQGVDVQLILIWKTLVEYAHSLRKRSESLEKGLPAWLRSHQHYYSSFNHFGAVKYRNYTGNPETVLQQACDYLGIPYFEGKREYWAKKHHSLWGNSSAELHLYSRESSDYRNVVQRNSQLVHQSSVSNSAEHYRQIFYDSPDEKEFQHQMAELRRNYPYLDQIEEMLLSRDIGNPAGWDKLWPDLQENVLKMQMVGTYKNVKEYYQYLRFKIRYAD